MSNAGSAATVGLVVFVIVAAIGFWGFTGVDPGKEKVIVQQGQLQDVKGEGWYWFNPVTTDTHRVSVRPQIYVQSGATGEGERGGDDSIESKTIDGNVVFADVAIRYRVTDSRTFYLNWFHNQWGKSPFLKFEDEKLRSPSRDLVRDIIGTIDSETVYTGEAQQMVEDRLAETMRTELEDSGAELIAVDVRNIRFSDDYQDTLERKANSVQEREIQTNLAEADAEAEIIRAEGEAEAAQIRAEGNAEADRIRNSELTNDVITIRYIDALGDANTVYIPTGSDGVPMFVDATTSNGTESESVEDVFGDE